MVKIAFANKIKNGFEVKEKNGKEKSENKRVQQVVKFILGKLNKIFHF